MGGSVQFSTRSDGYFSTPCTTHAQNGFRKGFPRRLVPSSDRYFRFSTSLVQGERFSLVLDAGCTCTYGLFIRSWMGLANLYNPHPAWKLVWVVVRWSVKGKVWPKLRKHLQSDDFQKDSHTQKRAIDHCCCCSGPGLLVARLSTILYNEPHRNVS